MNFSEILTEGSKTSHVSALQFGRSSAPATGAKYLCYAPATGGGGLKLRARNKARRFICFSGESIFADGEAVAAPLGKEGSQARQQWKNFHYNLDNTRTLAGRNSLWPDATLLVPYS